MLFKLLECSLILLDPFDRAVTLCQSVQGLGNPCKIANKYPIISSQPKELLYFLCARGSKPRCNFLQLPWIRCFSFPGLSTLLWAVETCISWVEASSQLAAAYQKLVVNVAGAL